MDDRGRNLPESVATLRAQQRQLIEGRRPAQMFPNGTPELRLPHGFDRVATARGVFHFNPRLVSADEVRQVSAIGRENEILGLGPYNKADVAQLIAMGEPLLAVVERSPEGIEVKAAAGTPSLVAAQLAALESMKSPGNVVGVEGIGLVLLGRMGA